MIGYTNEPPKKKAEIQWYGWRLTKIMHYITFRQDISSCEIYVWPRNLFRVFELLKVEDESVVNRS